MIAKGLVALLSVASIVAGQATTGAPNTAGIPQCLVTCTQASCSLTDLQCICVTKLTDITNCALSSCSQADLANASTIAAQQCAAYGGGSASGASSGAPPAVSSVASQVSSLVASVSSQVSSGVSSISSAMVSRSTSAASSAASGASSASKSASASAAGTTVPASGAEAVKAGSFFGLVGVIAGLIAL